MVVLLYGGVGAGLKVLSRQLRELTCPKRCSMELVSSWQPAP